MKFRGTVTFVAFSVIGIAGTAVTTHARALDMSNEAFMRAAVTLTVVEHAFQSCQMNQALQNGLSPDDLFKHAAWQQAHSVDAIRARLNELMADANIKRSIEEIKLSTSKNFRGKINACNFYRSAVSSPEAQFSSSAPEVLASLKIAYAGANSATRDPLKAAAGQDPTTTARDIGKSNSAAAVLAQIDSFGFDFRPIAGYGGVTMDIYPVLLFRNGDLLMDVSALAYAGGLEAHKKSKPDKWQKWRRNDGKLQRSGSEGWRDLAFQVSYPKLPDDFSLNGKFRSTSGIGTAGESVVAWRQYQFSANGQVEREAGVGSNSKVANGSTVSKTVAPNRKGSYRVEGLMLRMAYDDGSNESYVLVTDPKDPRAIWLDGVGYKQAKK
jgi:hypothetical protein